MAKRTRPVEGVQRNYAEFRLYPHTTQADEIRYQAVMAHDFKNAVHQYTIMRQAQSLDCEDCRSQSIAAGKRKYCNAHGIPYPDKKGTPSHERDPMSLSALITDLRDQSPEWSAISTWIPRLTAELYLAGWKRFQTELRKLRDPLYYRAQAEAFQNRTGRWPTKFELAGRPRFQKWDPEDFSVPHLMNNERRPDGKVPLGSGCKLIKSTRTKWNRPLRPGETPPRRPCANNWDAQVRGVPGLIRVRRDTPDVVVEEGIRQANGEWVGRKLRKAIIHEWNGATIGYRGGKWWMSATVKIEERRKSAHHEIPMTVRFGEVGCLAVVNNEAITMAHLSRIIWPDDPSKSLFALHEQKDRMKSEFDKQWPRFWIDGDGKRHVKKWTDDEWECRCEAAARIGRFSSWIARLTRHAIHVWSKRLVECASVLTIIECRIKGNTGTPRGNKDNWGAQVETVSSSNRLTLAYAPAAAAKMLQYKAKESGIRCVVIEDEAPNIGEGRDLVEASKTVRRANRVVEKEMEHVISN